MENLMREISELRLQDHILLLGHIPKLDQIYIMKECIAVIQPTLFEGGPGGGSVYDAVALGVPSIVSDIPVNKEIVDKNVLFFKAGSEQDLYHNMLKIMDSPRRIMEKEELIASENKRVERYAAKLLEAIQSARSVFHPGWK
jgi:glycosyltransferase involved in cell wall biosynthesis